MLPHLPELILDLVCERLSHEDVLALRSTCKDLKQFVDAKEFTRLNLFVRKFWFRRGLFYTGEAIGYPQSYRSIDPAIFTCNRFKKHFANLQRMIIYGEFPFNKLGCKDDNTLDLSHLNCFKALSHMEIRGFCIKGKLSLRELQIGLFHMSCGASKEEPDLFEFELNCPRLRALEIRFCRPVLSSKTDQLDCLHYVFNRAKIEYLKSIGPNLQKLTTICLGAAVEECLQFLSDLKTGSLVMPSLSQIKLRLDFKRSDELARILEDLKSDPRTKSVQFFFDRRLIGSPNELRHLASLISAHESETYARNLLKLSNTPNPSAEFRRIMSSRSFVSLWIYSLRDFELAFLNGNPELEFLLAEAREVDLAEDIELSEGMIRKLKNIRDLHLRDQYTPSDLTTELFVKNCTSLEHLTLYRQKVSERMLEMISDHLDRLAILNISQCKYETLKPLARFRNLEHLSLDCNPTKDELTFIFENSRTLETLFILCHTAMHGLELRRSTWQPKMYQIKVHKPEKTLRFDSLSAMIDYHYEEGLYRKYENDEISVKLNSLPDEMTRL